MILLPIAESKHIKVIALNRLSTNYVGPNHEL